MSIRSSGICTRHFHRRRSRPTQPHFGVASRRAIDTWDSPSFTGTFLTSGLYYPQIESKFRPEDCAACPVKTRCLSKPTSSRRYLSVPVDSQPPNLIDSEEGKQIYARRFGIVEPVFANICVHNRMHRFTLRTKVKVDVQWRRKATNMDKLISSLYDLIAYLVPGALVFTAVAYLATSADVNTQQTYSIPELALGLILMALMYTIGHLLHAIANYTIDRLPSGGYPPRDYFPEQFNKDFDLQFRITLFNRIVALFQLPEQSLGSGQGKIVDENKLALTVKNAYWPCYIVVEHSQAQSLAQRFSSISGLYRGLTIGSFVTALFYLIGAWHLNNLMLVWIALAAVGIAIVFLLRNIRFKYYLTKTVYSSFLHITRDHNDTKSRAGL